MESQERPQVQHLFVTACNMEDEDRLVAIRSRASALRKEEQELEQRINEKAVVRTLEQKLETYVSKLTTAGQTAAALQQERDAAIQTRETEKAKFEERMHTAQGEFEAISAKHDKLVTDLAIRDSALSECQTRNQHLVEELVSYRAQSFELVGTTAAFREQYDIQARRGANLYGKFQSLAHHSMRQEATINALRAEVEMLRNGWAKDAGVSPHNMHGSVGGPTEYDVIPSYAPTWCQMGDSEAVLTSGHMQGGGTHQRPARQPHFTAVEQDEEQSGSATRSDAARSGDSFHTAHASDYNQAASVAWVEEEDRLEVAREPSLGADLQETIKEPSCISKCEQKDVAVAETEAEGATLRALHAVNLTPNPTLPPNPPVQASRGGRMEEHAATTTPDIAEEPIAEVAVVPSSDVVQSSAAAEALQGPPAPLPTPPRKVVYVTPLPPGHLAGMSTSEQQTYKDALHRVCLPHPPSTPAPTPAVVYVTPVPPQLHSSSTHEVKEQRTNRRLGPRVGNRTGPADAQSTGSSSSTSQQAVANSQGVESHEAQMQAKKNAKKARKKRASQKRANAGS
ncbi:hypothetical protein ABBQ38_004582 [Trebouxia sp. C0009 RCD-2024]